MRLAYANIALSSVSEINAKHVICFLWFGLFCQSGTHFRKQIFVAIEHSFIAGIKRTSFSYPLKQEAATNASRIKIKSAVTIIK